MEKFAAVAPGVFLYYSGRANAAEAARLHRSREELAANSAARQSKGFATAKKIGAGEGNRSLVFSLEVSEFRKSYNSSSDNFQPCG